MQTAFRHPPGRVSQPRTACTCRMIPEQCNVLIHLTWILCTINLILWFLSWVILITIIGNWQSINDLFQDLTSQLNLIDRGYRVISLLVMSCQQSLEMGVYGFVICKSIYLSISGWDCVFRTLSHPIRQRIYQEFIFSSGFFPQQNKGTWKLLVSVVYVVHVSVQYWIYFHTLSLYQTDVDAFCWHLDQVLN